MTGHAQQQMDRAHAALSGHIPAYLAAMHFWGEDAQVDMAVEEMAELTVEVSRRRRGRGTNEDFASEVADVMIMMAQMSLVVDPELVADAVERKLLRLQERLRAAGQHRANACTAEGRTDD